MRLNPFSCCFQVQQTVSPTTPSNTPPNELNDSEKSAQTRHTEQHVYQLVVDSFDSSKERIHELLAEAFNLGSLSASRNSTQNEICNIGLEYMELKWKPNSTTSNQNELQIIRKLRMFPDLSLFNIQPYL